MSTLSAPPRVRVGIPGPRLDAETRDALDRLLAAGFERHEAIHRMGIWATPGGRLLVLDGLHPGGEVRQLAERELAADALAHEVLQ